MSPADRQPPGRTQLGPTRFRDLAAMVVVGAVVGYLLFLVSYAKLPAVPRLAGAAAAVIGICEAVYGYGLRARIRDSVLPAARRRRPPLPPLQAARALTVAKASALAGALFAGLWLGALAYLIPYLSTLVAAGDDTTAAVIGVCCAVAMVAGALWLEWCLRAPADPRDGDGRPS